ncbi:MAG: hypothetical protein EOM20_04330 [Spartobacteria bacterium]|nr:hypothetical protein [Spartobacteria bacterium]
MDNILIFTIAMIFLAAFVGTVVRYRTRDKCLKDLDDDFVTAEFTGGKQVWGRLAVCYNGVELVYPTPHPDPDGSHFETSFIIYQEQFGAIIAFKRLHDELLPENQAKREAELQRTYHPNMYRRFLRVLRNTFNLFHDAFSQTISVVIGSVRKTSQSEFVTTQDKRIEGTARELLGKPAAYEPILERHIGQKVVLELVRDGKPVEYCGVLKDYTSAFITLLDVPVNEESEFQLNAPEQLAVNHDLDFEVTSEPTENTDPPTVDLHVDLHNRSQRDIRLCQAEGDGYARDISQDIAPGAHYHFELPDVPLPVIRPQDDGTPPADTENNNTAKLLPDVRLWIRARRSMDMVVPRPQGVIRHGADNIGHLNTRFSLRLLG